MKKNRSFQKTTGKKKEERRAPCIQNRKRKGQSSQREPAKARQKREAEAAWVGKGEAKDGKNHTRPRRMIAINLGTKKKGDFGGISS